MITLEQIQKQLKDAILRSGLTQTSIAQQLGIKQQQISSYIYGKSLPALDTLANLCRILELDANEILCVK